MSAELDADRERTKALCEIDGGLSGWEVDFVESIAERVEGGATLTDKQRETADRILERFGR